MMPILKRQKVIALKTEDEFSYPYYIFIPETISKSPEIFVTIHGITRNAAEHCLRYAQNFDLDNTVIIAPLFSKDAFKHYQILRANDKGKRPCEALDAILDDVATRLEVCTNQFTLSGYSGGGQFAHRYAMLFPDKIKKLVLMAPGWFTFPNEDIAFPEGTGKNEGFSDLQLFPKGLLSFPIDIIVGERDSRRDKTLNRTPSIDKHQGRNRLERSQNWVNSIKNISIGSKDVSLIKLKLVPGAGHSFTANFNKKAYVKSVQQSTFPCKNTK